MEMYTFPDLLTSAWWLAIGRRLLEVSPLKRLQSPSRPSDQQSHRRCSSGKCTFDVDVHMSIVVTFKSRKFFGRVLSRLTGSHVVEQRNGLVHNEGKTDESVEVLTGVLNLRAESEYNQTLSLLICLRS